MAKWEQQEPGWWIKEGVGGIVREANRRWGCYPLGGGDEMPAHTSQTLAQAQRWMDAHSIDPAHGEE